MPDYFRSAPVYINKEVYRNIQNKVFLNADAEAVKEIAEKAKIMDVDFSAKLDGKKSTITLDGMKAAGFVQMMREQYNIPEKTEHSRNYADSKSYDKQPDSNASYINRENFRFIQNKTYLQTDSRTAQEIASKAQMMNVPFAAKINGDKSTVTFDGIKDSGFIQMMSSQYNIAPFRPQYSRQYNSQRYGTFSNAVGKMSAWADKVQNRKQQNELNRGNYYNRNNNAR